MIPNASRNSSIAPQNTLAPEELPRKTEVFRLDAYAPAEVEEKLEESGVTKAKLALLSCRLSLRGAPSASALRSWATRSLAYAVGALPADRRIRRPSQQKRPTGCHVAV